MATKNINKGQAKNVTLKKNFCARSWQHKHIDEYNKVIAEIEQTEYAIELSLFIDRSFKNSESIGYINRW